MTKVSSKLDHDLQDIAVRIAVHCVRNTVIEDYHAAGKLTDGEMKAFNKEVSNKIYTILQMLTSPHYAKITKKPYFFKELFYRPTDWDQPEIDKDFTGALAIREKMDNEKSQRAKA